MDSPSDEQSDPLADPKDKRITIRISDADLAALKAEAGRTHVPVGAVVRRLLRENLPPAEPTTVSAPAAHENGGEAPEPQ